MGRVYGGPKYISWLNELIHAKEVLSSKYTQSEGPPICSLDCRLRIQIVLTSPHQTQYPSQFYSISNKIYWKIELELP